MFEVGAMEVNALLSRQGERPIRVELKVSTFAMRTCAATTAYRSTVSLLRDGQMLLSWRQG